MTTVAPTSGVVAWQRLGRVTGAIGLSATILIFAVLVGTRQEPAFTAPATQFLTHYRSPNTVAGVPRSFLFTVGLVTFLWFAVAFSLVLRRAEGRHRGVR